MEPNQSISIQTEDRGFYRGFNTTVAACPKVLILALIFWVGLSPERAGEQLLALQLWSTSSFGGWYMYVTAFFTLACLFLALWPRTGKVVLGVAGEEPEFSMFTWLSMMFGAGIGVGMLTYSTAEPIFHFASNPDTIQGLSTGLDADNVRNAYKWALLHYGLTPWACYGVVGISLGYLCYSRGLPLTIRTGLQPLFGSSMSGALGHLVDIAAILATLIGLGVTIGYGVSQFASGMFNISGMQWIVDGAGKPTLAAQITGLVIIVGASCLSALSGLQRGIKWLSNINMGLSMFLVLFFILFGATAFAVKSFGYAIWDYLIALPSMSTTVWNNPDTDVGAALQSWQGAWNIFYWAWWIAFAPFVGATAIDLELSGVAQGAIVGADISAQLFKTINLMLSSELAIALSVVVVTLLLTFLVTSADSGILIINTLASGGSQTQKQAAHVIIWGVIFALLVGVLLAAGGMDALRSAMIIGALPFSLVMALMTVSMIKALLTHRD